MLLSQYDLNLGLLGVFKYYNFFRKLRLPRPKLALHESNTFEHCPTRWHLLLHLSNDVIHH